MKCKHRLVATVVLFALYLLVLFYFIDSPPEREKEDAALEITSQTEARKYAVLGCSTPTANSHRGYDYAFYLPLTAMAWKRIHFNSIVLIAGDEAEWQNDPALMVVLSSLKELNARVVFLDSHIENRPMLSQVARIFISNFKQVELNPNDYLITTDADLWPLLETHYEPKLGYELVLVHSECCKNFTFAEKTYRMLPMSNIGTTIQVWRDIVNHNKEIATNSETILQYLELYFGNVVRTAVKFASDEWFLDQKLVTMRIADWIERNPQEPVFRVSDKDLGRIDRLDFHPERLSQEDFRRNYDCHLPLNGFQPEIWGKIQFLIDLMYGKETPENRWCNNYALNFYEKYETLNKL